MVACATVEDSVHVPYVAHGTPRSDVQNVRVTVIASDARTTNRGRISTKKNGYGMDMAAIRTQDDLAEVTKNAIGDEFKARGYQLASGGVTVNADVTTFYADFKTGIVTGDADADVVMMVTETRDGRSLYSREVHGKGHKVVAMASGGNAAAALALALGNAIDQLFADPAFVNGLAR